MQCLIRILVIWPILLYLVNWNARWNSEITDPCLHTSDGDVDTFDILNSQIFNYFYTTILRRQDKLAVKFEWGHMH
jgi:hypothetical protein